MIRFESALVAFSLMWLGCGTPSSVTTPTRGTTTANTARPTAPSSVEPAPAPTDSDGDGIADTLDRCPCIAEDGDALSPEDGCPEPDNDGDGVCDFRDECINTPGLALARHEQAGCALVCLDCNGQPGDVQVDAIFSSGGTSVVGGDITRVFNKLLMATNLTKHVAETLGHTPASAELMFCRFGPTRRRVRDARIATLLGQARPEEQAFLTTSVRFGMSPLMSPDAIHCAPLPELQHVIDRRPLFDGVDDQALCQTELRTRTSCEAEDLDGDGVPNDIDQCIDLPEDADGFQDADGCPEHDNDGDGLCDADDACPDTPTTFTYVEDADGCAHGEGTRAWPTYLEIAYRGRTTHLDTQHPSHTALVEAGSTRITYEGPIVITVGAPHGAPLWVWESRASDIKERLLARGAHVSQFLISRDAHSSNISRVYADRMPPPTCTRQSWPAESTEPRMSPPETSGSEREEATENEADQLLESAAARIAGDEDPQPPLAPEADSP